MNQLLCRSVRLLAAVLVVTVLSAPSLAQHRAPRPTPLSEWVEGEVALIMANLNETGDLEDAITASDALLDRLIGHASFETLDQRAWADAAMTRRVLRHAEELSGDTQTEVLALWQRQQDLVQEVASAVRERDRLDRIYSILLALTERYEKEAAEFPSLVAAICVVFDTGRPFGMIEQRVPNPVGPIEIFEHLGGNARRLQINPQHLPPELLVFVVDTPVSPEDLQWALQNYGARPDVGRAYHDVQYDVNNLLSGDTLQIDRAIEGQGEVFGLESLRRHGGVCRQQAFFAVNVGKAVGVPTAYARAFGPSLGHAWVGYLARRGRMTAWDFSEGRWDDYLNIRGEVFCPQTGGDLGDEDVALLADLASSTPYERLASIALLDAAERIAELETDDEAPAWDPQRPPLLSAEELEGAPARVNGFLRRKGLERERRERGDALRFELLEQGLRTVPASPRGWAMLEGWSGELDEDGRQFWFEIASRLVGRRFPDVLRRIVIGLAGGITDPAAHDAALIWLVNAVGVKPQLRCEIVLERARLMVAHGEKDAAWGLLGDVAVRSAADAPQVVDLLREMERISAGMPNADSYLIPVYRRAFNAARTPSSAVAGYAQFSTKARVGRRLAQILRRAGLHSDARTIENAIQQYNVQP
ncbi:MAG: hypothetical protein AAGI17_05000 [Planctomycetota bacterium]